MPVEKIDETSEQKQENERLRSDEQSKFMEALKTSDILRTLDLPAEKAAEEEDQQPSEEEQPEEDEEIGEDEESQADEKEENAEESEEDEEEMIPKSKIQKRINKFKSEAEYWKNKYNTEAKAAKQKPADETTQKLETMSNDELRNLKREIRMAQLDAKDDKGKLSQLLDLEEKIDNTLREAPQRFNSRQVEYFNQVASDIAASEDFEEKDAPRILEIAKEIYSSDEDLQKDIKGQGLALKWAARHYKEISRLNSKAKENPKLKGQLNTLKKKTALDTKTIKGSGDNSIAANLLRKSRSTGLTSRERISLVANDPQFGIDSLVASIQKDR